MQQERLKFVSFSWCSFFIKITKYLPGYYVFSLIFTVIGVFMSLLTKCIFHPDERLAYDCNNDLLPGNQMPRVLNVIEPLDLAYCNTVVFLSNIP